MRAKLKFTHFFNVFFFLEILKFFHFIDFYGKYHSIKKIQLETMNLMKGFIWLFFEWRIKFCYKMNA